MRKTPANGTRQKTSAARTRRRGRSAPARGTRELMPIPQFRDLADAAPVMIWVTDATGRLTFVNAAWRDFAGHDRPRSLGGRWARGVHPDDVRETLVTFRDAFASRQAFRMEFRLKRTDGEYRWILATGNPIVAGRKFLGYVGSALDITLRKHGEEALRESEARYRHLAQSVGDVLYAADRALRCTFWNRAAERFTGVPASRALGMPLEDLLPAFSGSVLEALHVSTIESGKPGTTVYQVEREGHPRVCEAYLYPAKGGLTAIIKDVTSRREVERAVQVSEENYRQIFQHANDPMLVVEPEGEVILDVNDKACEVYGRSREELIGHSLKTLTKDLQRWGEQMRETLRAGASHDIPTVHLGKDGAELHFLVNASVIDYHARRALLCINRDISHHIRALAGDGRGRESFLEHARDAALLASPTRHIVFASRSATLLTGYESAELATMSLDDLFDDGHAGDHLGRALAGEDVIWEGRLRRKDGTLLDVEAHCAGVAAPDGRYVQAVLHDLTRTSRAEAALRESEELMRRLVESTDDIITLQDIQGRYMYFNGASHYNLTRDDVVGKMPADLYPSETAARMLEDLRSVVVTGESVSRETRVVWNGIGHWFLDHISPMRDPSGRIAAVVTVSRNIGDWKASEEHVREREQRYREFITHNVDGIWRMETERPIPVDLPQDEQIRWVSRHAYLAECNDALARMYGFDSAEALAGARFGQFFRRWGHEELLRRFLESGYRLEDFRHTIVSPDGTSRYFQNTLVGTVENGCLVRAWGIQRDVTARDSAERIMRLLAQTVASARDCIAINDLEGHLLFVNEAFTRTYGFSEEELRGQHVSIVHPPDADPESFANILASSLEDGWHGEIMNRRKDGTVFPIELWASIVRNDEGQPVAMVGVARDITSRREAEEQIRASLREKDVLLKEIHHRVKNNLQIVSSLLSLQSEHITDPAVLKVLLESQTRVKSMALIHEKLYRSSNLAAIDFGEYLRELASHLFRSYGAGAKSISLEVDAEPVSLGLDRAIPAGIMVNELLSNAMKYAFPDGRRGRVYVTLHQAGDGTVDLVVGDTGVGIPAGMDYRTTDSLGLKLVNMLAMQIQGTLTLAGDTGGGAPGGAEFLIRFKV